MGGPGVTVTVTGDGAQGVLQMELQLKLGSVPRRRDRGLAWEERGKGEGGPFL